MEIKYQCIYWGLRFQFERYKLPPYTTENCMPANDTVSLDDKVHAPNRLNFLTSYVTELSKAVNDGVEVKGYFLWSLMGNFELYSEIRLKAV